MTEKEIIREWKKNEKPFGLVCKEMQDWAENAGKKEFSVYGSDGWYSPPLNVNWCVIQAYRLRQDYPEPSEVVECEVEEDGCGILCCFYQTQKYTIDTVTRKRNFISYKSGDYLFGRLYKAKKDGTIWQSIPYKDLDQYEVLPIDAVVFKEVR